LNQWEESYKKGLLSFWLLLLLAQRKAYPYEIKAAINEMSRNTINADREQHLPGPQPPGGFRGSWTVNCLPRKPAPTALFLPDQPWPGAAQLFITRNILVFEQAEVADLIQKTITPKGTSKG